MKKDRLRTGKLPIKILEKLLKKYTCKGNDVVIGPSIGIDATVIRFTSNLLVAKTDPITFVAEDIGLYTISVNSNDIAAMGGIPRWFLATILLPEEKATNRMVKKIFSQLSQACRDLNISLCGGHTEVTTGIDRPIVIGQMLGEVREKDLVTAAGARVGNDIILTKGIAIEATSIIGRKKERELRTRFSGNFVTRCRNTIKRPGLSVIKDAQCAIRSGKINAMHDPTEGGLATGLHELAIASKVGILVEKDAIHILPECEQLCRYFDLNPLGAIASGALLITLHPRYSKKVFENLGKQ